MKKTLIILRSLPVMLKSSYEQLFSSKSQDSTIIISRSEYESMKETLHLLGSTKNAQRIFESLEEFKEK